MRNTNRLDFRDTVYQALFECWKTTVTGIVGYEPVAYWPKKEEKEEPPIGKVWGRFSIRHFSGGAATIGGKNFIRRGSIFVQIFTPTDARSGLETDDRVADAVLDIMERNQLGNGIFLREAFAQEIGISDAWFQTNVQAVFEYTQSR